VHLNSKLLFQKYALPYFADGMRVLEIGPDAVPSSYQAIVGKTGITWHTIDMFDSPNLTYRNSGEYSFPIETGSYDLVLSAQVIEHVRKIWNWMGEVSRVCKPGGTIITINPVSFRYHEAPIDCWRIYPEGMKALYDDAGVDTLLSTAEALEPFSIGLKHGLRLVKKMVFRGKIPSTGLPPILDTISIGKKRTAERAAA
jgi:SAM-dependent methyltransferase